MCSIMRSKIFVSTITSKIINLTFVFETNLSTQTIIIEQTFPRFAFSWHGWSRTWKQIITDTKNAIPHCNNTTQAYYPDWNRKHKSSILVGEKCRVHYESEINAKVKDVYECHASPSLQRQVYDRHTSSFLLGHGIRFFFHGSVFILVLSLKEVEWAERE